MLMARLLSDTRLQYRGWPPFARPSADRISVSTTSFSRVWRCYILVRTTSRTKIARILAHVPRAHSCSLGALSCAWRISMRGGLQASRIGRHGNGMARHRAAPHSNAQHRTARVDDDDISVSVRRGWNKFTIYAGCSISICISNKYAGNWVTQRVAWASFWLWIPENIACSRERGMGISHCATRILGINDPAAKDRLFLW